jgi:hypothetical protein
MSKRKRRGRNARTGWSKPLSMRSRPASIWVNITLRPVPFHRTGGCTSPLGCPGMSSGRDSSWPRVVAVSRRSPYRRGFIPPANPANRLPRDFAGFAGLGLLQRPESGRKEPLAGKRSISGHGDLIVTGVSSPLLRVVDHHALADSKTSRARAAIRCVSLTA